jgi:hypothetical protein
MTEPQTITSEHLRRLLDAETDGATLGLIEGRVDLVEADSDDHRGAIEVISRDDLVERLGDDPTEETLVEQAEALTAVVHQIGG